jgi:hypothetical protein
MADTEQTSTCRNRKEKNYKRHIEIFKKILVEILVENTRKNKAWQTENTDDVDERRAYFSLKIHIIRFLY